MIGQLRDPGLASCLLGWCLAVAGTKMGEELGCLISLELEPLIMTESSCILEVDDFVDRVTGSRGEG